jgi:predicted TIM-barrel fold metal-dependent hydrolase
MEEADGPALIDCHAHIFRRGLPLVANAWMEPGYDFTAEDYLAILDAHAIRFGVLSALSITGHYNEYTLAATRAHKRLRATVLLAPGMGSREMRALAEDGVVGLRLQLVRATELPDLREEGYRNTLRRARDMGWHVHLALEGERLAPVLEQLREIGVPIVLDHFGHPTPADPLGCPGYRAMVEAVDEGRTWVKLSGGFRLAGPSSWTEQSIDPWGHAERIALQLVHEIGTERLLWGSDAPFVGYEGRIYYADTIAAFQRWVPDASMRRAIDETGLRFYFPGELEKSKLSR